MSFWSGETLKKRLPSIIRAPDYSEDQIDCNAYTMHLGAEIYVSPARKKFAAEVKAKLEQGSGRAIPPGQFAFLLTEEYVEIPRDAMAFISMRSTYKFKGLVNVSGFHVDPGYRGRLVFAVFNASANHIQLHRGDSCFLIWFADLDQASSPPFVKTKEGLVDIPSSIINPVGSGKIESLAGLSSRIDGVSNRLNVLYAVVFLVAGAVITASTGQCREAGRQATTPVTVVVPGASQAPAASGPPTSAPAAETSPANVSPTSQRPAPSLRDTPATSPPARRNPPASPRTPK
jgi:dCTP deaminase